MEIAIIVFIITTIIMFKYASGENFFEKSVTEAETEAQEVFSNEKSEYKKIFNISDSEEIFLNQLLISLKDNSIRFLENGDVTRPKKLNHLNNIKVRHKYVGCEIKFIFKNESFKIKTLDHFEAQKLILILSSHLERNLQLK